VLDPLNKQYDRKHTTSTVLVRCSLSEHSRAAYYLHIDFFQAHTVHNETHVFHYNMYVQLPPLGDGAQSFLSPQSRRRAARNPDQLESTPLLRLNCVGLLEKNAICCSR
jgi:hypothetical protein